MDLGPRASPGRAVGAPGPGTDAVPQLPWNGDLVVYAHGYVPDLGQPVAIPEDQLDFDGVYLPDLINSMGYAFAVTSYSVNGLAVPEGVADVRDLVSVFKHTV